MAVVELLRVQLGRCPGMDTGTGTLYNSLVQAQRGVPADFGYGLLEMIGNGNRLEAVAKTVQQRYLTLRRA